MDQDDGQDDGRMMARMIAKNLHGPGTLHHPGHHPGHPAIILAIVLVYPSFILPDYAIILPGRMLGTLSSWSSCTGLSMWHHY